MTANVEANSSKRSHHRGSSGTGGTLEKKWPLKTKVDKNKLTIEPIEIDWQWQQLRRKSMNSPSSNSLTNVNGQAVKGASETVDSAISRGSIRVKRNGK